MNKVLKLMRKVGNIYMRIISNSVMIPTGTIPIRN